MMSKANDGKIAYFSMEIALAPSIPSYSGGLGILAGDTLRSAADLELPLVAISLVYRKGYFRQRLDALGNQTEEPDVWEPQTRLQPANRTVTASIEGREGKLQAWRYDLTGRSGTAVPTYVRSPHPPTNSVADWN